MNKHLSHLLKHEYNIQWNLAQADSESIVFYFSSKKDEVALKLFEERILDKEYCAIITNLEVKHNKVFHIDENEYHQVMKDFCDFYLPISSKKTNIAITGTNGKSTTVDFIRQLLVLKKINVLTIGTMGVYLNNDKVEDFGLTSPHFIDLRKTLVKYESEYDFLAVESSSHSLHQKRQYGLIYDYIGWTSFSQDHLDYHRDMEDYFNCKMLLQNQSSSPFIVSTRAGDFINRFKHKKVKYENKTNLMFLNITYNKINLDIALGILDECGISFNKSEIEKLTPTPGRFNVIDNSEQKIVIDFAHTPDSLENVLLAIKSSFNQHLVCVFGCGGNRDKTKRPLMGIAAENNSDFQIITSDNPRFEEPDQIIKDIETALVGSEYKSIVDRKEAIEYAIEKFPKSIILIAGKGHEEYVDINGEKKYFSDAEVVNEKIKKS